MSPDLTGDARIQAEIDAAWAAHEGDREPGISDLEWQGNTGRTFVAEFEAGRAADWQTRIRRSNEMRDRQPQVVVDDEREAA